MKTKLLCTILLASSLFISMSTCGQANSFGPVLLAEGKTSVQNTQASPYSEYISKLNNTDINSISLAVNKYKELFKAENNPENEKAFLLFHKFYYEVIKNNENLLNDNEIQSSFFSNDKSNKKLNALKNSLAKNGLKISMTEGFAYLDEQPDYIEKNFTPYLNTSYKVYYKQKTIENKEGFTEDAGLVISYDKLRTRIEFWGNFNDKYKDGVLHENGEYLLNLYLSVYLTGIDNSPVFDNNKLVSEVKKSYKNLIKNSRNKDKLFYKIVKGYYAILQKTDFKDTKKLAEYLKQYNLNSMMGIQPPF